MNTAFKAGVALVIAAGSAVAATHFLKNGGISEAKRLLGVKNDSAEPTCDLSDCDVRHDDTDPVVDSVTDYAKEASESM